MTSFDYLLLPRLEVRNANAVSSYWALSPEVVMAARQFGHALARYLGTVPNEAGVAIIHHHVEMLGERLPKDRFFRPHQRRGAVFIDPHDYSDKNKHALSMQPTASMHLRVSLVLRFHAGTALDRTRIQRFLHGGRLKGGQIVEHGKIEVVDRESAVLDRFHSGYVVVERPDLLHMLEGDSDIVDPFFRALAGIEKNSQGGAENDSKVDQKKNHSWLVPAILGYATISDIRFRPGAREGYPTAYAEPLVGLIQYQSIRKAKQSESLPFWDYHYPEPGVFVVTHDNPTTRG